MAAESQDERERREEEQAQRRRRRAWLDRRRSERILFDFGPPPGSKVCCGIVDAHTHPGSPDVTETFVRVAQSYGVKRIVGITGMEAAEKLRQAFPGVYDFAVGFNYEILGDVEQFRKENIELLERTHAGGLRIVKFWFKPEFNEARGLKLDDPRMDPLFDRMEELGFSSIAHIADPDLWFTTRYKDGARFGTKEETFVQLENRLASHRGVKIVGAHMGGDPENLRHLAELLQRHQNYAIDCSATKWVARELSKKPKEAREFFLTFQDRIIYGTDLVAWEGAPERHYASRFWTLNRLLESDYRGLSPIYDEEGGGEVQIAGLDLPADVLEKIYCENAERWLSVRPAA